METKHRRSECRDITHHQFDIHVSHACNFSCESCSHYSQYHFSGNLSLEAAESWHQRWSARPRPFRINLVGGEPATNPKMAEHVLLARKYWPRTERYLYTNGFLLHRHPHFPAAVQHVDNFVVKLSRHHDSPAYNDTFDGVVKLLESWKQQYGIGFAISDSASRWTRRYLDEGGRLVPFQDNDPKRSWEQTVVERWHDNEVARGGDLQRLVPRQVARHVDRLVRHEAVDDVSAALPIFLAEIRADDQEPHVDASPDDAQRAHQNVGALLFPRFCLTTSGREGSRPRHRPFAQSLGRAFFLLPPMVWPAGFAAPPDTFPAYA